MLKVGILSDEISQEFEYAIKTIRELGAGYVELRTMWGKNLVELSPTELKKARALIENNDMKVCLIASPVFKCHLGEKRINSTRKDASPIEKKSYSEHLEILEHSLELARMFNSPFVRTFSFWKEGSLTDEILQEIVQRFEEPVRKAEKENIILALENEYNCYIGNAEDSKRFFDRIPSRNIGLIWDPGNAYFTGETPYPDGYRLVKDRTVHIHIRGAGKNNEGEPIWLPVSKGEIDIKGQLKALADADFPGVVSLETHYVPKGGSKEDGTRESFRGLRSILQSLGVKIAQ